MTHEEKRRNKYPDYPTNRDAPLMLYDLSIESLEERRLKALPFRNGFEVAEFIGHDGTISITRVIDKPGKYIEDKNGKQWAVRTKKA